MNGKEQRILVMGDADFMDNSELSRQSIRTANFKYMSSIFRWFSYGEFPIDTSRVDTPDTKITIDGQQIHLLKILSLGVISLLIVFSAGILLISRNRR